MSKSSMKQSSNGSNNNGNNNEATNKKVPSSQTGDVAHHENQDALSNSSCTTRSSSSSTTTTTSSEKQPLISKQGKALVDSKTIDCNNHYNINDNNDDDDDDDDESTSSVPLLNTLESQDQLGDLESIGLLKQIFPDLSTDELRQLHHDRIHSVSSRDDGEGNSYVMPTSKLGQRIWKEYSQSNPDASWEPTIIPNDFLQLPSSLAVRRFDESNQVWRYQLVQELEARALNQIRQHETQQEALIRSNATTPIVTYTAVVRRDAKVGLGMTLHEDEHGKILRVLKLSTNQNDNSQKIGPSYHAGIQPNDMLIGINGSSLRQSVAPNDSLLHHAVTVIHTSPDPVVLHLQRKLPPIPASPSLTPNISLLDTSVSIDVDDDADNDNDNDNDADDSQQGDDDKKQQHKIPQRPSIHPLATALASRGLLQQKSDERIITRTLAHFTDRTRQWESTSSYRIDANTFELRPHFDPKDLPPEMAQLVLPFDYTAAKSINTYAPSTPTLEPQSPLIPEEYLDAYYGTTKPFADKNLGSLSDEKEPLVVANNNKSNNDNKHNDTHYRDSKRKLNFGGIKKKAQSLKKNFPARRTTTTYESLKDEQPTIFIPLMGVRKALCARIVNTFLEETRIAYTIWVYDVESGKEWYAPIRYFKDFQELRAATMPLNPTMIDRIPFPNTGWNVFGTKKYECQESSRVREAKCRQLEHFLRALCAMIYCHKLHPEVAEIAIHVQSFLGCDNTFLSADGSYVDSHNNSPTSQYQIQPPPGHTPHQAHVRLMLKRSLQRYIYRLFLLGTLRNIVDQFVDTMRARGLRLGDIEALEKAEGRASLKARAMEEIERIQNFLDKLQELILEGCEDDLHSIAGRRNFHAIRSFINEQGTYWDRLVREAVREQIEIEIYVPLRGIVSRLLVHGWRHEDMEAHFKIRELRKRPQGMFHIPQSKTSPSSWQSVAKILKEGVGLSTLPCAKLRAIVEAAREISSLYEREHNHQLSEQQLYSNNMVTTTSSQTNDTQSQTCTDEDGEHLGADDFLPIFIFCVVRAEMERPCALCVLLQTLCDKINRIGEIGYFLASFEAAITHIQEIDLTEDREDMLSFLTVPLTEISLEE